MVAVVVVVLVVTVGVGHRPSPGWQSGTSDCDGHGKPSSHHIGSRVIFIILSFRCSQAIVQWLNSYAQSLKFVVVVLAVVDVIVVVVLVVVVLVVMVLVVMVFVVVGLVGLVRHHGIVRHPLTSSKRSYSTHNVLFTAKSACRAPIKKHRWVLCFHCTIRHVSP